MTNHYTHTDNGKRGEAVLAMVLAVAVWNLNGLTAQWCGLAERITWAAFEILRFVLMTGCSQTGSRLLQLFVHVGPWFWWVLQLVACRA